MKKLDNKIFLVENNDKNGIFPFEMFQQKIVKSRVMI